MNFWNIHENTQNQKNWPRWFKEMALGGEVESKGVQQGEEETHQRELKYAFLDPREHTLRLRKAVPMLTASICAHLCSSHPSGALHAYSDWIFLSPLSGRFIDEKHWGTGNLSMK